MSPAGPSALRRRARTALVLVVVGAMTASTMWFSPGASVASAALQPQATLVATTALSALPIPSPDTTGVAWIRHQDRLLLVDSEVNEMPWLFGTYATNVFPITAGGTLSVSETGNTTTWTNEPTGVTYNTSNRHIFTSDDDRDRVYEFDAGPDGRYASSDDIVSSFSTRAVGNTDAEDVAYDTSTGHLWVVDGASQEVFHYAPGPDLKFGTTDDPAPTHWDVGVYGALDPEGIAYYEADGTLLVLDGKSKKIYVVTTTGQLVQTIGIGAAKPVKAAGIGLAPPSNGGPGLNIYITDRGIDNDTNPTENDGKLYEMSAGLSASTSNQPPSASAAAPPAAAGADRIVATSTFPVAATVDASASSDPEGQPLTYVWQQIAGPAATITSPVAATTAVSLPVVGTYEFRVTVTDNGAPPLSATASVRIIVQEADPAVTVQRSVTTGTDDAEETVPSGGIQLTSNDLDMVIDSTTHRSAALRFTDVTIPPGATITGASIQFRSDEVGSDAVTLTIAGQAADNPPTFTATKFDLSSRPRTAAAVQWTPPPWTVLNQTGPDQRTPGLTPIVQELVDRSGWSSGNAMVFFVQGPATGTRVADSIEGGAAPTLTITYVP